VGINNFPLAFQRFVAVLRRGLSPDKFRREFNILDKPDSELTEKGAARFEMVECHGRWITRTLWLHSKNSAAECQSPRRIVAPLKKGLTFLETVRKPRKFQSLFI
jgi:hypothetical protein